MHELSDEWNGEWSDADMAAAINAEFGTTITQKGINYHTNWVLPDEWDLKAVSSWLFRRAPKGSFLCGISAEIFSRDFCTLKSALMGG